MYGETQMSPIDEAKLANRTPYTEDITRLKTLNEKLIEENNRLAKENDELKEKLADQKKLMDTIATAMATAIRTNDFVTALENWFKSK